MYVMYTFYLHFIYFCRVYRVIWKYGEENKSSILQFIFLDRHKLSDTWCFEITAATHSWSLLRKNICEFNPSKKIKKSLPPILSTLAHLNWNLISTTDVRGVGFGLVVGWGEITRLTNPYTISPPAAPWCDGQVSTSRLKITNIINEARTRHQPSPALQLGELLQLLLNYYWLLYFRVGQSWQHESPPRPRPGRHGRGCPQEALLQVPLHPDGAREKYLVCTIKIFDVWLCRLVAAAASWAALTPTPGSSPTRSLCSEV